MTNVFGLVGVIASAFIMSITASMVGIGGGVIFVPLYVLFAQMELKKAIFLSIITIAGNSLGRFMYYPFKRHPKHPNRYLVNYGVLRVALPFMANAIYLGFWFNQILPDLVVLILIIVFMIALIYKITGKAIKIYKTSKEVVEHEMTEEPDPEAGGGVTGEHWSDVVNNLVFLLFTLFLVLVFNVMRSKFIGINPWYIYLAQVLMIMLLGYLTIHHLKMIDEARKAENFQFITGDIDWTDWKSSAIFSAASSLAGILAAMIGIGGGLILNPTQLHFNIDPIMMVATSSLFTLFSSILGAIQYSLNNPALIEWIHGAVFAAGFLGAWMAIGIAKLIGKHLQLVILILLDVCVGIALILLLITKIP